METIVIATVHAWNAKNAKTLCEKNTGYNIVVIDKKEELEKVVDINPKYVFFPHWSWAIPSEVYEDVTCIVFHMTDLPFGRGGSPLQNLISRGVTETKISAIRVCEEIDAGDIYMQEPLSLYGGAEEIYIRASEIIFAKMIPYIIENDPVAVPQNGDVVSFSRRTLAMSELSQDMSITQVFDYIRMLDAEGYPKAFIKWGKYRLRFSRPKRTVKGIVSDVELEVEDDRL